MKHVSHVTRAVPQWGLEGEEPEDYTCVCVPDCPACRRAEFEHVLKRFTEDEE